MRYVDFHSHILPKMDDGSRNGRMSVDMLDMLAEEKVCTVFATPHFYCYNESIASFLERRDSALRILNDALSDSLNAVEVRMGAEIRVVREMPAFDENDIGCLKLEGTDLMLFELPYNNYDAYMGENIHNISVKHGIRPVIAHVERYLSLYSSTDYEELLSIPNVICQITSDFYESKKKAEFTANLIHDGVPVIFGSDCHNTKDRPPLMHSGFSRLKKFCTKYKISVSDMEELFNYQLSLI